MATILGTPKVQYFKTGTSDFLNGGKLYSYSAGTSTPKDTYPTVADALAGTNPNTNPVILDSRGEAMIVIQGNTKLILKDENDVQIWSVDNIDQSATDILDANGNELLKFVSTASAVNEWTITNAATTGSPRFDATGSDTNVSGKISSKGSGALYVDGGSTGDLELNNTSTGTIRARRAVSCSSTLGVTGATTLSSTLGVTGATTLSSTLGVTGAATLSSTLAVTGNTTVGGTFNYVPAGVIWPYGGSAAPSGFLLCDGSAVSRTTYSVLFGIIGTTFGSGDGSTTFNLPTTARKVMVGAGGSGTATLGNAVGNTGGAETVTLVNANMPAGVPINTSSTGNQAAQAGASFNTPANASVAYTAGSATAVSIMQPSLVLNYIIKT